MLTGRVLGHAQRMSSADLSAGLAVKPEVKAIEMLKVCCASCHSLLGCAAGMHLRPQLPASAAA